MSEIVQTGILQISEHIDYLIGFSESEIFKDVDDGYAYWIDEQIPLFYGDAAEVDEALISLTEQFLEEIVNLDNCVAINHSVRNGCLYTLSSIDLQKEFLFMIYCGVNVNSQWSAIFKKNLDYGWAFQRFGFA